MDTYAIKRFYAPAMNKRSRIISRGLSLEDAQRHCNDEKTHKKDKNGNVVYFDGYTKE